MIVTSFITILKKVPFHIFYRILHKKQELSLLHSSATLTIAAE